VIPPDEVARIAERYPWAEVWDVPRATHMTPYQTEPAEYAARVRAVLADAFSAVPGGAQGS
jgi:hypothetical protein